MQENKERQTAFMCSLLAPTSKFGSCNYDMTRIQVLLVGNKKKMDVQWKQVFFVGCILFYESKQLSTHFFQ